jgi:hypothetical protein
MANRSSEMKKIPQSDSESGETHADSSYSQRVSKTLKKDEKLFGKLRSEFEGASGLSLEDRILKGQYKPVYASATVVGNKK